MLFQGMIKSGILAAILVATVDALPATKPVNASSTRVLPARQETPSGPIFISYPDDPSGPERLQRLQEGFRDAVLIAKIVMLRSFLDGDDDTFGNYFLSVDFDFVREVFGRIANVDASANTREEILRQIGTRPLNPKYRKLTIHVGDDRRLPDDKQECGDGRSWSAYTWQFDDVPDTKDPKAASMSMCDLAFEFPSLARIRDPAGAGPGCEGMGTKDNGWMTSLGSQILHELIHWRYLGEDIADYNKRVRKNDPADPDEERHIIDYTKENQLEPGRYGEPPSGYGPGYAHELTVFHDISTTGPQKGYHDGLNNADNWRWYAMSKYWRHMCGRDFGSVELDDNADYGDLLREEWNADHPGVPARGFQPDERGRERLSVPRGTRVR